MTLRVEIQLPETARAGEPCTLRTALFNDSYAPVEVSRNAFVGPNLHDSALGAPRPESVEATFGGPEEPLTLQPLTFYGRERTFENLQTGEATVVAYYRGPDGGEEITASQTFTVS